MPISLSERELKHRPLGIREMLEPIGGSSIAAHRDILYVHSVTFGVLNGSRTTSAIRDWRFKTKDHNVKANYIERWAILKDKYSLSIAYLTIHDGRSNDEKELFSLHCDPMEPKDSKYYLYKSGPHIHVKTGNDKVSQGHIALNLFNLGDVVSSYISLNNALKSAIKMIAHELI